MARIPTAEVEKLKTDVSVERLVESAGIALKKSGKDKLGCCPFHEDGEPSLVISPAKNLWHCFACQIGGGPIDWVMKMKGVSFRHAVELLRDDPSLAAQGGSSAPVKKNSVRSLPAPVAFDADEQVQLNQTIDFYHETLRQAPEALAYLAARGLVHPELINTFKLGYANRTLGLRLPAKNRLAGAEVRSKLEKIGIYRATGHEHFAGSLVVPVLDEAGNVLEVYGRKITENLRKGTPLHLYLPGAHRGVWNEAAMAMAPEMILCEALIDAMTLWCAGFRNVTAAYGVEGFTPDHMAALLRHGVKRVLIAYDRDEAGERAAEKLAAQLMAQGVECYRVLFPLGMDANSYALSITGGAQAVTEALGQVLRKAQWLGKGGAPMGAPAQASAPAHIHEGALTHVSSPTHERAPEPAPVQASPVPAPVVPPAHETKGDDVYFTYGAGAQQRRYRVRGLGKNLAVAVLKINLMVNVGEAFYVDTLDLYSAKQRAAFVVQAGVETGIDAALLKGDLGRVLLALEQMQDVAIQKALNPEPVAQVIDEAGRVAALALLSAPDLIGRIGADMEAIGITGEGVNKLVGYLAATSRKLANPLAVVIRSSSAAGKTSLMDAVLSLMPEEERIKYSAMTGQSLFYMGQANLKHKILALAEEEGASRASYALKLLQSEGELTMASTGKDPVSGNLITQEYRVEGPVMLFTTTTALDLDPELLNRCLVLTVDESREQTQAIHRLQRNKRTLEGLAVRQEKEAIISLHQNAQRLLKPLAVMNPFAGQLTFPDNATRTRRDHEKYLTLIDTIALLHQHQRPIKRARHRGIELEYIEVTAQDIACANGLAHEVLGRSLDELPPQTRSLLQALCGMVGQRAQVEGVLPFEVRFTRREVREVLGVGDTQLRLHMDRLVEFEYIIPRRDGPGGRFLYELAYAVGTDEGRAHLPGLIDVAALYAGMTDNSRGQAAEVVGDARGDSGPIAGGSRGEKNGANAAPARLAADSDEKSAEMHIPVKNEKVTSYMNAQSYIHGAPGAPEV